MVLKEVLVTGSKGKIGRRLVPHLKKKGWTVSEFEGRLENKKTVLDQLKGVEYVIHLAVYQNPNDKSYEKFFKTNVEGTENLLEAIDKKTIKKIVYFSSNVVWEKKKDFYAKSKKEALEVVRKYQKILPIISVFPSVVINKKEKCPPNIWWQKILWMLAGGFPGAISTLVGNRKRKIKVVFIDELIYRIERLLLDGSKKEYDMSGKEYRVKEYRRLMKKIYEKE